ncbi:MAG TPA: hypothetical protein VJ385_02990, partial [Fibrobacteria bacterium]|nr:hypothetical protein [Fibrobacteria bacterium]
MRLPGIRSRIKLFLCGGAGLSARLSLTGCLLLSGCLLCSGCLFSGDGKVAQGGAQDFPNTVSLGLAASSHVSDHTGWDQFSVIPSSLPTFQN